MVGGQVNPIISIIIDNNDNNNDNDNDNSNNSNNNNYYYYYYYYYYYCNYSISLNSFQHQCLKWGRRKVFTSTAAFRLQDLCGKVQLFLCGRPRDHEILSITARVRCDGILYWNLAAIRVFSKSKVS